MTDGRIDE